MYELKRSFKCPYCASKITMTFMDETNLHREDCQVCFNTVELCYQVDDDRDLVYFQVRSAKPLHNPFASDWFN